jgi:hypothetical protein
LKTLKKRLYKLARCAIVYWKICRMIIVDRL